MALGERLDPLLDAPGIDRRDRPLRPRRAGRGAPARPSAPPATSSAAAGCSSTTDDRDDPDLLPWRPAAALAEVRLGHRAQGAALARAHLALSRLAEAPYAVALGLRALAIVDPRGDGIALLREARAVLADVPAARLAAQIETDLAGQLLLTGGPSGQDEALALLRGAEEYAGREELWPLQGRVRRLLDRLGEPARAGAGRGARHADRVGAADRPARRRRPDQPRDRRPAGGHGQGRRVAPLARLPQARHPLPGRRSPS